MPEITVSNVLRTLDVMHTVADAEDITEAGGSRRSFSPRVLRIRDTNGVLYAEAQGQVRKKDGTLGVSPVTLVWDQAVLDRAPQWVQDAVAAHRDRYGRAGALTWPAAD